MHSLTLSQAGEFLNGELIGTDARFSSVSSDSRQIHTGQLFVALRGPNFDGHDYVRQARAKGAVAALVDQPMAISVPQLRVTDTLVGLGELAAVWRQLFQVPVIGVTGSNGKTTVKEMIAAILGQKGTVLATRGNLNNQIGMPLTLLRLQDEAYAVLELGAGAPGEIAYLSAIARPDVAVLNNAGRAHLQGFGSLEGVARAKAEIITGLRPGGTLVINGDDPWAGLWRRQAGSHKLLSFGVDAEADVRADLRQLRTEWNSQTFSCHVPVQTPAGVLEIALALAGRHNLMNALAAIAASLAVGADLQSIHDGLAGLPPVAGRLQSRTGVSGLRVIDDTYNANPDSVAAAIEVLASAPGRRWLILGDLSELGPESHQLHAELGKRAEAAGLEYLCTIGSSSRVASQAFGEGASHFDDQHTLISTLQDHLRPKDWVLVKGSRSAAMERVVEGLLQGREV